MGVFQVYKEYIQGLFTWINVRGFISQNNINYVSLLIVTFFCISIKNY